MKRSTVLISALGFAMGVNVALLGLRVGPGEALIQAAVGTVIALGFSEWALLFEGRY